MMLRFASDYLDPDKIIIEEPAEEPENEESTIFGLWIPRIWLEEVGIYTNHEGLEILLQIHERQWDYRIEDTDHIGWDFYHMEDAEYVVGILNRAKRNWLHGWKSGDPRRED